MFSADLGVTPSSANYIEDVFSTYLYTGTGANQTITNGIDLSTKGGMVWTKGRSAAQPNSVFDTARGATNQLVTNSTAANNVAGTSLTAFTSTGFTLGAYGDVNSNGTTMVSWTFRKQAKFFDVVTYTGNGTNRTIAHNLGSVPGSIFVKRTDTTGAWAVYHRSLANTQYMVLNTTAAAATGATYWNSTTPTSSVFSLGTSTDVNASGGTYVAYIFAHDAGGFGATGLDNVISCGSFTTDGSGNGTLQVLGYEPQWVMVKAATGAAEEWVINDTMRGMFANPTGSAYALRPNASNAETLYGLGANISSTGFTGFGSASRTYIYIAIRRGPMRTPTTGTSVFEIDTASSYAANEIIPTSFPPDISINKARIALNNWWLPSRITGGYLSPNQTATEVSGVWKWDGIAGQSYATSVYTDTPIYYSFRRAPGFFDVVCYTGTGASATLNHNLGVSPEMVIIKGRSVVSNWETYLSLLGGTGGNGLAINDSGAKSGTPPVSSVTATTFTLNNGVSTSSGQTYVAYLFATVAGVSKVGSYTGTGTTNQINCGFTAGARFVLIKRTDSTGSWWVFDSARGIVPGNDPALQLNSTAAEVTTVDAVDADSIGFVVNQETTCNLNVNGGTYVFLAVS